MKNKKNLKRITAFAIVISMIMSQTAFGATVPSDVIGQSYETAVAALFDKGIITGDENGMFNPDQTLTRAQACLIVVKSMNPPVTEVTGTATQDVLKSGFPDMAGYSWADGYIGYAVKKGVAKGYPNGTFKPGNKVTTNELVTMLLRGAGYFDADLEGNWPGNYINAAETLNLYAGLPHRDTMPELASKWMAAQMAHNAVELIEEANKPAASPTFGIAKTLPNLEGARFMLNGSFDPTVSSYGGIPLSDTMQLYTYLEREDYTPELLFSDVLREYNTENIYKYKRVVTPAWYVLVNGRIETLILPRDVGYTGTVYCVINDRIDGLSTLTAAREMNWKLGPDTKNNLTGVTTLDGTVFKLTATAGLIRKIEPMPDMGTGYKSVEDYKINGPVKIGAGDSGRWIDVSPTATIYVIGSSLHNTYRVGSTANIKNGSQIKLFDVSDDDENRADIIVIKE